MRGHIEPDFDYRGDLDGERARIAEHRDTRWVPAKREDNLLIASWNLAALGVHERAFWHLALMAEILRPFDVVAVQEVGEDLTQLQVVLGELGEHWRGIYTAAEGDDERLAFLFDTERVQPGGLATELRMETRPDRFVRVGDVEEFLTEKHRDPYLVRFEAGDFPITLMNVHLYRTSAEMRRRQALALARWAAGRVAADHAPNGDLVLLGDFNLPRLHPGSQIHAEYEALGMMMPDHETHVVRTNYARDRHYDALAFFPAKTAKGFTATLGVFDFDAVVFPDLYAEDPARFYQYLRYCLSDHRPLWIELAR